MLACPDPRMVVEGRRAVPGFRIVPVGVYEEAGSFYLNFGKAYPLVVPPGLSTAEKDHKVAEIVMRAIAVQLPGRLRGEFQTG